LISSKTITISPQIHVDYDDFSDYASEYSDSEDVPAVTQRGWKIWDYFYVTKQNLAKGIDCVQVVYRKEKGNMLLKFEHKKGGKPFHFKPTNTVRHK
jgi:hypothetical protein